MKKKNSKVAQFIFPIIFSLTLSLAINFNIDININTFVLSGSESVLQTYI